MCYYNYVLLPVLSVPLKAVCLSVFQMTIGDQRVALCDQGVSIRVGLHIQVSLCMIGLLLCVISVSLSVISVLLCVISVSLRV